MRILVTGATGQLGTELCRMLAGETVIPMDLPEFDLTAPEVEKQIIAARPDVVMHAGAYTDVDGAERNPDLATAVNVNGTERVARAATRVGARLIYLSTDYVFDGKQAVPYREEDGPRPVNRYGWSKWQGEQAVLASGAASVIVRTAWLFGQSGNNFVKSIIAGARSRPVLKVVSDQRGCPTYAADLACTLVELLEREVEGIIHVTNGGEASWYEFAQAIVREMELSNSVSSITSEEAGRPAKRPAYSVLSGSRLASLGLALPEWRDALRRCLQTHRHAFAGCR